eukprot:GHVO01065007.1.p1 GENE.GHVO01065007.1~~GHVO01065007.1.p1  ORF type:complete len:300 (-),score=37.69 GHVO01065007.1:160-1059(-)
MTSDQLQEAYLEKADPLSVMRLLQALLVFEGSMANRNSDVLLDDDGGLLDDDDGGLEQGFNVMYPNDLMGGSSSTLPKWKFQDLDKLSDIISGRSAGTSGTTSRYQSVNPRTAQPASSSPRKGRRTSVRGRSSRQPTNPKKHPQHPGQPYHPQSYPGQPYHPQSYPGQPYHPQSYTQHPSSPREQRGCPIPPTPQPCWQPYHQPAPQPWQPYHQPAPQPHYCEQLGYPIGPPAAFTTEQVNQIDEIIGQSGEAVLLDTSQLGQQEGIGYPGVPAGVPPVLNSDGQLILQDPRPNLDSAW